MFRSQSEDFVPPAQIGCCTLILKFFQYCGLCRGRGYSTNFLEDRVEPQGQGHATAYQAPSPSGSTASFNQERHSPERTALLAKATELHHGGQSSSGNTRLTTRQTPETTKQERRPGEGGSAPPRVRSLEQLASPQKAGKESKEGSIKGGKQKEFSNLSLASLEDEDICSTCLDGYNEDNPKIWTRCGHHFHLACIYEWLERKQTCPLCETQMNFEELV